MAILRQTETGRRLRRIVVKADFIQELMTVGWASDLRASCVAGLPPGAVFMASTFDPGDLLVSMFFFHPSFDPVPDGETVPELPVAWHWERPESLGVTVVNEGGTK